jgi:DNA-binding response OmpR family regulator
VKEVFARSKTAGCNLVPILERQGLSVFVVDDEELITKSLTQILRNEGFAVTPFTNPLRALKQIKSVAPDLLISDVMMPELSGIDLARETRKALPDCKILLFSGAAEDLLRDTAGQGFGFRLLPKPLHPTELLQEIEALTGTSAECGDGIKFGTPCERVIQPRPV